jgi:hypothetical protein
MYISAATDSAKASCTASCSRCTAPKLLLQRLHHELNHPTSHPDDPTLQLASHNHQLSNSWHPKRILQRCSIYCLGCLQWVEPAVHACISEAAFASRKWEARRGVFCLLFLLAYAYAFTAPITFLTALQQPAIWA